MIFHLNISNRTFTPLVALVDCLLEFKAEVTLKRIASLLATKRKEYYSHTCSYMKSRLTITLVKATHRCMYGGRVMASHISVKRPHFEDSAGLYLYN